jgi:hypothetical protein
MHAMQHWSNWSKLVCKILTSCSTNTNKPNQTTKLPTTLRNNHTKQSTTMSSKTGTAGGVVSGDAIQDMFNKALAAVVQQANAGVPSTDDLVVARLGRGRENVSVPDICRALSLLDVCGDSDADNAWREFAEIAMARYRQVVMAAQLKGAFMFAGCFTFKQLVVLFDAYDAIGSAAAMATTEVQQAAACVTLAESVLNTVFASADLTWPCKAPTISPEKAKATCAKQLMELLSRTTDKQQKAFYQALQTLHTNAATTSANSDTANANSNTANATNTAGTATANSNTATTTNATNTAGTATANSNTATTTNATNTAGAANSNTTTTTNATNTAGAANSNTTTTTTNATNTAGAANSNTANATIATATSNATVGATAATTEAIGDDDTEMFS